MVTVPLSILKANVITFEPDLPDRKLKAIDKLGAGVIEKVRNTFCEETIVYICEQVVLKFPYAFWRKKVGDADFFGHVAKTKEDRGFFPMFYDMVYCVDLKINLYTYHCFPRERRNPSHQLGNPQTMSLMWLFLLQSSQVKHLTRYKTSVTSALCNNAWIP